MVLGSCSQETEVSNTDSDYCRLKVKPLFLYFLTLQNAEWQSLHRMVASPQYMVVVPQEVVGCPAGANLPHLLVQVNVFYALT